MTTLNTIIEEIHSTREVEDTTAEKLAHEIAKLFDDGFTTPTFGQIEKIENLLHHQLQKAREEERERIKAFIENKRIPLFVAVDEDDARRIFMFNEDLDIMLKAIDHSELDQDVSHNP